MMVDAILSVEFRTLFLFKSFIIYLIYAYFILIYKHILHIDIHIIHINTLYIDTHIYIYYHICIVKLNWFKLSYIMFALCT